MAKKEAQYNQLQNKEIIGWIWEFYADALNGKRLTDVTEFKYYVGSEIRKLYLSAILDLYDRQIVAYKIGNSDNNQLVFDNFNEAVALNQDVRPLFHSDRGF